MKQGTILLGLAALCLLIIQSGFGQITVTYTDIQGSLLNSRWASQSGSGSGEIFVGNGSAGQTWDYTGLDFGSPIMEDYLAPAGKPGVDSFPTATVCHMQYDTVTGPPSYTVSVAEYFTLTTNGLFVLGEAIRTQYQSTPPEGVPADTTIYLMMQHHFIALPLPLSAGSEWVHSDTLVFFPGYYTAYFDSFKVFGSGTVLLPGGHAYDALRLIHTQTATSVTPFTNTPTTRRYVQFIGNGMNMEFMVDSAQSADSITASEINLSQRQGTLGIQQTSSVIPAVMRLSQNYPNPFNPSTTISFDVPREEYVSLNVYNVIGQEVAVLANGRYAPGSYQAVFDASGLPSGVYIYRLSNGAQSQTKSMLLVR